MLEVCEKEGKTEHYLFIALFKQFFSSPSIYFIEVASMEEGPYSFSIVNFVLFQTNQNGIYQQFYHCVKDNTLYHWYVKVITILYKHNFP